MTHNNRFKKVLKTFEREHSGSLVSISDGIGGNTISATSEHPIFAIKRSDVLCKYNDSTKGRGNYVCRPKKEGVQYSRPCNSCGYYNNRVLSMNNIKEVPISELQVGDFITYPIDMTTTGDEIIKVVNSTHGNSKKLPNKVSLTHSIMRMFGLWLADGSYIKNGKGVTGVVFSQRSDRKDHINSFKKGIKDGFGLDCVEYTRIEKTELKGKKYETAMTNVVCSSISLSETFYRLFGEYSYGKKIPAIFNNISTSLQLSLCLGYIEGDGCIRQNNSSNSLRIDIVGQSIDLLKSIKFMLLRNRIVSSIFRENSDNGIELHRLVVQGNDVNTIKNLLTSKGAAVNDSNVKDVRNRFFIGNYLVSQIKTVNTSLFNGKVYNIEVEDDNSYTVEGIAVHNCNLNRNQQRKDIPRTIAAFNEFKKIVPDSILYLHMAKKDQGWDLPEIIQAYGLSVTGDVIFPENFGPNQGYPLGVVNMIYNVSDCVISTTLGEGFGLAWLEAMTTKTPVIVPNNTAMPEFVTEDRGWLVNSGDNPTLYTVVPHDNEIVRPLVDVEDMVEKMLYVYNNKEEAQRRSENAYSWVLTKMDWNGNIVPRWITVFDRAFQDLIEEDSNVVDSGKKIIEAESF